MTIHPDTFGIDVSKHHLDVFDPRQGSVYRVPNTSQEAARLATRIADCNGFAVFEATGSYDAALRRALSAVGARHARVNPAQARDFARAIGRRAKTDAVDARMLAELGQRLAPRPCMACDGDRERLGILNKRRDQLVAILQQERARQDEAGGDGALLPSIQEHLNWLDAAIDDLDSRIRALLQATPSLQQDERLLRTVPGIGPVSAAVMLANMPELGTLSPKAIAALGGLAPYNNDSGRFQGKRSVRGGRKRVRDALYMAAVSASRTKTRLGAFYRNLRDAGKPPKVAFIALARKILIILNAILRSRTAYQAS
jgi:transposase